MAEPFYKPPWLDRIRFIGKYYISGCEAPWGIYAESALPAVKRTLLVFVDISIDQVIKEFFRPKGLRSRRHGRKGWKSRGRRGGIPDIDELVAKGLPGKDDYYNRRYGVGTAVFYVIDDVIDRVEWTVLLLEMVDDITYSSLLGAMEWNSNKCEQIRRMWRRGRYHVEGGAGPTWEPVGAGPIIYNYGIGSPHDEVFYLPAGTFSCTFGAKIKAPSGERQVRLRFRQIESPYKIYTEGGPFTAPQSENGDALINAVIQGPTGVVIEGAEDGGFWDINYSDLCILEVL